MQAHIINRQLAIVASYIAYLENSNKYIEVLDVSRLKEKVEAIKKVYLEAGDRHWKQHLYTCNVSVGMLELSTSKLTCRFVIEDILLDLHDYELDLKKSLTKVDRTVAVMC